MTQSLNSAALTLDAVADASVVLPQAGAAPAAAAAPSPAPAPAAASAPAPAPAAAPRPATLAELKAACPGAGNDFLVQQLEVGATAAAATTAYLGQLQKENADLKVKAAQPQPAPAAATVRAPGAAPIPAAAGGEKSTSATGDAAIDAFEAAVSQEMEQRKVPRHVAHANVCRKEPQLREAMLAAHNAQHRKHARSS